MERLQVPEYLRKAMEASGADPKEVVTKAADPEVIPTDAAAVIKDLEDQRTGIRCAECGHPTNPNDKGVLIEVTGWSKQRDAGGQNHVIRRSPTGKIMCETCAIRFVHGLATGQEAIGGNF